MSKVKPYELLSLASLPRTAALLIAERSARQFAEENGGSANWPCVPGPLPDGRIWSESLQVWVHPDDPGPAALVEALTIPPPPPRTMWNYRCNLCRAELPVFQDNNLCAECDFGVVD